MMGAAMVRFMQQRRDLFFVGEDVPADSDEDVFPAPYPARFREHAPIRREYDRNAEKRVDVRNHPRGPAIPSAI